MLSREADACYWIGRYVERAEATARMVDIQYHFALESGREVTPWAPMLEVAEGAEDFHRRWGEETDRNALHFFAFDEQNPTVIAVEVALDLAAHQACACTDDPCFEGAGEGGALGQRQTAVAEPPGGDQRGG